MQPHTTRPRARRSARSTPAEPRLPRPRSAPAEPPPPRPRPWRARLSAACAAIASCLLLALALGACGDTVQDQPIGPAPLETVLVKSRFPVYWLGLEYGGMRITGVTIDPSQAVTIHYGDCVLGGQYTCVTPIAIVSSPDNSFVPGRAEIAPRTRPVRGVQANAARGGATLAIATGGIVVSVFARDAALARATAGTMVPLNEPGLPGRPLPAAEKDTGFGEAPLPSQVLPGVSVPRPR